MYLLDTNVISELRKPRPHGAVVAWFLAQGEATLRISAVTIGEMQRGIERTRKNDPQKAAERDLWLQELASLYHVLPMDAAVFREWGRLMEAHPGHPLEDTMIAATARVHNLTLATRNLKDFLRLGVALHNPFAN